MSTMRTTVAFIMAAGFVSAAAPAFAKQCYAPDERAQTRAFSRIVTTEGGKTLWLAGSTGDAKTGFDRQVRDVFAELDKNIKAQGGSGLADIVAITVFITDTRFGERLIELREETVQECLPAN